MGEKWYRWSNFGKYEFVMTAGCNFPSLRSNFEMQNRNMIQKQSVDRSITWLTSGYVDGRAPPLTF
jgi:hypothetical protein